MGCRYSLHTRFGVLRALFPIPEFLHHDMACTQAEIFQQVQAQRYVVVNMEAGAVVVL